MQKNTFPTELTALPQWVGYRLEPDKTGRICKIPYCPHTGKRASSTDPQSWGTFEQAVHARELYKFTGIGFVFTEDCGIVGIDIDHCLDSDGNPNAIAADIHSRLPPTYIELSPSKSGLHIFLKGSLPKGGNRNSTTGVEIYSNARYFTMTGNRHPNCADLIADDNGVLSWIHSTYVASPKSAKSPKKQSTTTFAPLTTTQIPDDKILEMARKSKDGGAFDKLYSGDWQGAYKSQSEADFALCCKLAFWTGKVESQMDRLFRQSGLMREKWGISYSDGLTYGAKTILNACANTTKTYSPKTSKPKKEADVSEIFEQNGEYWRSKNQKTYPLTNFKIVPVEMIESEDESQLSCVLVTTAGEKFEMDFMANDFANLHKFKSVITKRTIALSFFGGEGDLELFKQFVYKLGWTKKRGVKALGIYPNKNSLVFVDTKGAVGAGGKRVDTKVQIEKHKQIESTILEAPLITKNQLLEVGKYILAHNAKPRSVSILAWCAGCFIKPHLRRLKIKYPHLFMVGQKGGGKTTCMELIVLILFGLKNTTPASQCKAFGLMQFSASSNVIPHAIDEFKPPELSKQCLNDLRAHFRNAWDFTIGTRGRPDLTSQKYELLAPIVVAGEQDTNDAAIRERIIELLFSQKDIANDVCFEAITWIRTSENVVRSFGRSLLDMALRTSTNEVADWCSEGRDFFTKTLPPRIFDNLCAVYTGLCLINKLCQFHGLSFADVFGVTNEDCAENLDYAIRKYMLDDSNYNKGVIEQSFEVMARMKLKYGKHYTFENNGQFLLLNFKSFYDDFRFYCERFKVEIGDLPLNQFKKQLTQTEYFISKSAQKWLDNQNRRAWVVDFSKLSQNCDVSGFEQDFDESNTDPESPPKT